MARYLISSFLQCLSLINSLHNFTPDGIGVEFSLGKVTDMSDVGEAVVSSLTLSTSFGPNSIFPGWSNKTCISLVQKKKYEIEATSVPEMHHNHKMFCVA